MPRPIYVRNKSLAKALIDDGRQRRQVAAAVGVNPVTFSGYVSGRCWPGPATQQRIAAELGRSVEELFDDAGVPA